MAGDKSNIGREDGVGDGGAVAGPRQVAGAAGGQGVTDGVDGIFELVRRAISTPDALREWLEGMQPSDEVGRASGGPDGVLVTWLRRTTPLSPATTFLIESKVLNVRVRGDRADDHAQCAAPLPGWAVALSTIEREEAVGLAPEQRWRASEVLGWLGRIKD